jgi:hypothetical protein
MSEQNIKGKWKVLINKKDTKTTSPMVGMVYRGVSKFFGKEVTGILLEVYNENDEAIIRTKENKLISVDKNTLKIVA